MAKSAADKLGIKTGTRIWVHPADRSGVIGPLPDGASLVSDLASATIAIVVADDGAAVRAALSGDAERLRACGVLWVAYPKGNRTDINRDSLWPILAGYRFRPNAQVAIDETWSALRFRPDRDDEAPFALGR